jgi:hypothetical protein
MLVAPATVLVARQTIRHVLTVLRRHVVLALALAALENELGLRHFDHSPLAVKQPGRGSNAAQT